MLKKLRVPVEIGEKAYFTTPTDRLGDKLPFVQLEDYSIKDGRVEWRMRTHDGQIIEGRVRDQEALPIYQDAWIALAIPVTLHVKTRGLVPDFIFCVPGKVNITRTPSVKRTDVS